MATNQKSLGTFLLKKPIKNGGYYEILFDSFWLDLPTRNNRVPIIVKMTNNKTESYQVAPPIQFKYGTVIPIIRNSKPKIISRLTDPFFIFCKNKVYWLSFV